MRRARRLVAAQPGHVVAAAWRAGLHPLRAAMPECWDTRGPAPHLALVAVAGHAAAAALRPRLHLRRAASLFFARTRRRARRRIRRRRGDGKGTVHSGQAGGVFGVAGRRDAGQRGLRARGLRRRRAPARSSAVCD